jgi:large subunit ribosomal protein L22
MSLTQKTSIKTLNKRSLQKRKNRQVPILANAKAKVIRMSPLKVRRVLKQIEGCSYEEALILLRFLPYRACYPVAKVLKSAAANALNNQLIPKSYLRIEKAFVGPGPILKRMHPRSKGRGFPIMKRTSHISIVLSSTFSRYESNLDGEFLPVSIR